MGGGSSETPKLYYVIYEQPLKASGLKMEHLPADHHHHHHHHGNHHDLYDPHHNDDGVNARNYNTDQGGQEEQDFTLVFFVIFFHCEEWGWGWKVQWSNGGDKNADQSCRTMRESLLASWPRAPWYWPAQWPLMGAWPENRHPHHCHCENCESESNIPTYMLHEETQWMYCVNCVGWLIPPPALARYLFSTQKKTFPKWLDFCVYVPQRQMFLKLAG